MGLRCATVVRLIRADKGLFWDGGFSLVGLTGGGSIPSLILCLGGSFSFLCLSAMSYFAELPMQKKKEAPMEEMKRSVIRCRIEKSLISTVWSTGTAMLAGALPG